MSKQEVNVDVLYSILQFGSGYRLEFHKYCGRGASDGLNSFFQKKKSKNLKMICFLKKKSVIVYGLMQMLLAEVNFKAKFLKNFTIQQASEYFNFPLRVFQKYDDMPFEVTQDSELMPFALKMKMVMNHLGEQLEKVREFFCLEKFVKI